MKQCELVIVNYESLCLSMIIDAYSTNTIRSIQSISHFRRGVCETSTRIAQARHATGWITTSICNSPLNSPLTSPLNTPPQQTESPQPIKKPSLKRVRDSDEQALVSAGFRIEQRSRPNGSHDWTDVCVVRPRHSQVIKGLRLCGGHCYGESLDDAHHKQLLACLVSTVSNKRVLSYHVALLQRCYIGLRD